MMKVIEMTAFDLAQRLVGEIKEIPGTQDSPFIQWCLECCSGFGPDEPDETPWCAAFVSRICWMLRLPRSKSAAARSWLNYGTPVPIEEAKPGFDVVIIQRGEGPQPGPEVTSGAPGHVGFFAGHEGELLSILGGNQSNSITVARFPKSRLLGIRRLV